MAYSQEEIDKTFKDIIRFISDDAFSLSKICRMKDMPCKTTFYEWIDADKAKMNQYMRATELRSEVIFEEILDISDAVDKDVVEDAEGNEVINHHVIQRDRLRTDSRKWMLGKMNPKKYSDKIQLDTTSFKEQPLFNLDD